MLIPIPFYSRDAHKVLKLARKNAETDSRLASPVDLLNAVVSLDLALAGELQSLGMTPELIRTVAGNEERVELKQTEPVRQKNRNLGASIIKRFTGPSPYSKEISTTVLRAWEHCKTQQRNVLKVEDLLWGLLAIDDATLTKLLDSLNLKAADLQARIEHVGR